LTFTVPSSGSGIKEAAGFLKTLIVFLILDRVLLSRVKSNEK
jgi:hypothetical protein